MKSVEHLVNEIYTILYGGVDQILQDSQSAHDDNDVFVVVKRNKVE